MHLLRHMILYLDVLEKHKGQAKEFLNSNFEEPLTDDELEDNFMFLDSETDFENPEAFDNETN